MKQMLHSLMLALKQELHNSSKEKLKVINCEYILITFSIYIKKNSSENTLILFSPQATICHCSEFSEPPGPAVIVGKGVCFSLTAVLMHVVHPNRAPRQITVLPHELYCQRSLQQKSNFCNFCSNFSPPTWQKWLYLASLKNIKETFNPAFIIFKSWAIL